MTKLINRTSHDRDDIAKNIVFDYVIQHLDPAYDVTEDCIPYIVWKCKTLQNWKYLLSTDLHDGMYYELTYNGDKNEYYLDVYKKFENIRIDGDVKFTYRDNNMPSNEEGD